MTAETSTEQKPGFFRSLGQRRVPQVMGLYMAGSWTLMEFLESIIGRLNLSPHWSDITLLTILVMLPTVIMLAYRHGAPGHQPWTRVEHIGIPVNILVVVGLTALLFADKDLGYRSEMIQAESPDGTMVQVFVPKEEFRKRLAVAFFDISSPDLDDYLALGAPVALSLDLDQDPYINSFGPATFNQPLRQAGFTDLQAPLALLLKYAREWQLEFLVTGKITNTAEAGYQINLTIYQTEDGKVIEQLSARDSTNLFSAIDQLTPDIKAAIGISDAIIEEQVDLPIEEQLTSNMEAYKSYIEYMDLNILKRDFTAAENKIKRAIELDQSFAYAASHYATYLLNQSRVDEGLEILKLANKHNYRLHMSTKFYLSTFGSMFAGEFEKAWAIIEQWLTLEPESVDAWSMKAGLHSNLRERELAIEAYQRLIELEPYGTNRYLAIGQLYASMGDKESAISYYEQFLALEPTNPTVHILLGDFYREQGNFELSSQQYTKAQVLYTNDITADRRLTENLKRIGNFAEAEALYLRLLEEASTPQPQYELSRELAELYLETGRGSKALEYFDMSHEFLKQIAPEGTVFTTQMRDTWVYALEGQYERGQAIIDQIKDKIALYDNEMFNSNLLISEAMFNLFKGSTDDPIALINKVNENARQFVGSGSDSTFLMLRGIANHFIDNHELAAEQLSTFLKEFPRVDESLWFLVGSSFKELGQFAEARAAFNTILKVYPAYPDALFGLAQVHAKTNEIEAARESVQLALQGWSEAEEQFEEKKKAQQLLAELGQ